MKKQKVKLLNLKKFKIASLRETNRILGGETGADNDCTNTNTNSAFCPPASLSCKDCDKIETEGC